MAEKIRYTRKDLKGPDEFISTFGRIVAWCKENRSKVELAAAVVAAVLLLTFGTRAYFHWQENKAARDLWPYLDQARDALSVPPDADPGKLADLERSIATRAETYPGSRASVYAEYYLGSIAFRRGDFERSASRFREGIRIGKDEGIMKYLLRDGVGRALEAKGDYAGAAGAYREAAGVAEEQMKVQSQVAEARVLALSGKKADAVSLYRQILKENPESRLRDLIDFKLAQME